MRKIRRSRKRGLWCLMAGLFLFAVMMLCIANPQSAEAASYKAVNAAQDPTVGGYTFSYEYDSCLYASKGDSSYRLYYGSGLRPTIVTNGSYVFYSTLDFTTGKATVYKVKITTGKAKKMFSVTSWDDFTLCGYRDGKIYYVKNFDPGTFCSYTVSTGKKKSLVSGVTNVEQSGKYFLLTPYQGDVSACTLKVYNSSTGKKKTITKKLFTYTVISGKIYYVEFKSSTVDGWGPWKVSVKRCSMSGGSKKTLVSSLTVQGIVKIGKSSIRYLNSSGATKTKKY